MTNTASPKSTPRWVWIVGGLAVLAAVIVLVLLVSNNQGDDTATGGATTTSSAGSGGTTTPEAGNEASATVAKLQSGLTALGYYTGSIDGLYGTATTEAVKALQTDLGVEPVDGLYGPATHEALTEALGDDPAAEIITELQTELKALGYYDGSADGVYGPATVEAVKKLQADCGLNQDGIYGPATHTCLIDLGGDA